MKTVVIGCLCAAALAGAGCGGRGVPTSPDATPQAVDQSLSASPRTGALHVTKTCSRTEPICTIATSNLAAIEVGSRITYLQPANLATPDGSAVVLDLPGPGNNTAAGRCTLDPQENFSGHCTFSGGTGKFTWFQASVAVSHDANFLWYWEGTYSFSPPE